MAIIYNTNISYAHDTTHACLSLLYLGLCRSVERLSVSDVDMDGSCSLALAQMTACYAIISETNLHCSHLAALRATVASASAASININWQWYLVEQQRTLLPSRMGKDWMTFHGYNQCSEFQTMLWHAWVLTTTMVLFQKIAKTKKIRVSQLEFNVPFQHKYGYIRDEEKIRRWLSKRRWWWNCSHAMNFLHMIANGIDNSSCLHRKLNLQFVPLICFTMLALYQTVSD